MKKKNKKPVPQELPEMPKQEPIAKTKVYLLSVDDTVTGMLSLLMPSLKFIEVEGFDLEGNDKFRILVNPIPEKS